MFLMETCIVSCQCHKTRLSSRLQHIYSNDSVNHGTEIKKKGTSSNRDRWINKALIMGIRKIFKGRNILAVPAAPFFLRIRLTGLWQHLRCPSAPPFIMVSTKDLSTYWPSLPWTQGSAFLDGDLCEQSTCVPLPPKPHLQGHWMEMEMERTKETASALSTSINPGNTRGERTFILYHQRDLVFWEIKIF